MCSQILLNKVVKRQFSRNAIWTGTPGKLLFWANDSPVWLRNWRSDFLHSYLIVCELFSSSLSLKNVIFCSILLCYDTFYRKIFTNIVYECLICTTTSKKTQFKHIFQKWNPPENGCLVKFVLYGGLYVLLFDSSLLSVFGHLGNQVFRWPGASLCIQITFHMIWRPNGIQKSIFNQKQGGEILGVNWAVFVEPQLKQIKI